MGSWVKKSTEVFLYDNRSWKPGAVRKHSLAGARVFGGSSCWGGWAQGLCSQINVDLNLSSVVYKLHCLPLLNLSDLYVLNTLATILFYYIISYPRQLGNGRHIRVMFFKSSNLNFYRPSLLNDKWVNV